MLTAQEVYNQVRDGLKSQGWLKSEAAHNYAGCAYRGAGGKKCSAGWLIPDSLYQEKMEGLTFHSVIALFPELVHLKSNARLITALQQAPESGVSPEALQANLHDVAIRFRLVP